jgi:hypothetical protein
MNTWEKQICDVCKFVDGDSTVKECYWCTTCSAWICRKDEFRLDRRALAMIKRRKNTGCKSCTDKRDTAGGVPMFDELTRKRVSEMTQSEREAFALREASKDIMARTDLTPQEKRIKVQKLESEFERSNVV